jgi:hypothetical protein
MVGVEVGCTSGMSKELLEERTFPKLGSSFRDGHRRDLPQCPYQCTVRNHMYVS